MKFWVGSAAFAALFLAQCRPSDGCIPQATRCDGNVAQICDADQYWQDLADCDMVSSDAGVAFVCRFVSETNDDGEVVGHTCVPAVSPLAVGDPL